MPTTSTLQIGIVLCGEQPPADLLRAVEDRHWSARVVSSSVRAMAELCIATRTQRQRAAWGLRIESPVLVLGASASSADVDDLLAAIGRYLPEIAVWRYDGSGLQPCRTTTDATEHGDGTPDRAPRTSSRPAGSAAITRQELDMLLEMDGGD